MSFLAPEILDLIQRGFIDEKLNPMPGVTQHYDGTTVHLTKSDELLQKEAKEVEAKKIEAKNKTKMKTKDKNSETKQVNNDNEDLFVDLDKLEPPPLRKSTNTLYRFSDVN